MTETVSTLFVSFPATQGELLHWWHVRGGVLLSNGCDNDPLLAAKLKLQADDAEPFQTVAMVPSALTVVRWHDSISDASEMQSLAAAQLHARESSLQSDSCHVAVAADQDGQIVTATADQNVIANGLADLAERDLDPDYIAPSGCLVSLTENQVVEVEFGFDQLLVGPQLIAPNDPGLREQLVANAPAEILDIETTGQNLPHVDLHSLPNLRSGLFAKKSRRRMTHGQRNILGWMAAAVLILSLLIPAIHMVRLHWEIDDANGQSLAAAEPVIGDAADPDSAEQKLDAKLISEGRGNVIFSVPASALFSAIQQTPDVSIGRLSYRQDGIISAELSAVRNEDINPALVAIQNAGFVITATARTDATGVAKADITVRAP